MSNQLAMTNQTGALEALVLGGDLSKLSPDQRIDYYMMRCSAADLDPRTRPFELLSLSGKLVLYATKNATEQLCERRELSIEIVSESADLGLWRVQARCKSKDGRTTDNIGVVDISNLGGEKLANAMMKAVTKAFRRAVLAHCGLGMLDETETETIPGATTVPLALPYEPANVAPEPSYAQTEASPEVASDALMARCETLRCDAVARGFKTPSGAIPKQLTGKRAAQKVREVIAIYEEFIETNPEAEIVEPLDVHPMFSALGDIVGTGGFRAFERECHTAGLRFDTDADFDKFEGAYQAMNPQAEIRAAMFIEQDWANAAAEVAKGELKWN